MRLSLLFKDASAKLTEFLPNIMNLETSLLDVRVICVAAASSRCIFSMHLINCRFSRRCQTICTTLLRISSTFTVASHKDVERNEVEPVLLVVFHLAA